MPIVSIIKLFLTLASSLAEYARDKKLMDAGASEAILQGIRDADNAIARANLARANAGSLPVESDEANRDGRK